MGENASRRRPPIIASNANNAMPAYAAARDSQPSVTLAPMVTRMPVWMMPPKVVTARYCRKGSLVEPAAKLTRL
jgi:hypothetical protein